MNVSKKCDQFCGRIVDPKVARELVGQPRVKRRSGSALGWQRDNIFQPILLKLFNEINTGIDIFTLQ